MDAWIAVTVNHAFAAPYRGALMVMITEPRSWAVALVMLIIGMTTVDRRRGVVTVGVAAAAVAVGDFLGHTVIKPIFARPRPCAVLDAMQPLVGCTDSFSLPSNHAINSFALAAVVGAFFPIMRWPMLGVALLVAFSRVAVGVHYLSDVTAGALIGFGVGTGAVWLARRCGAPPSLAEPSK
jgi:undecaprenyl-diphosphatase